MTRIFVAVAFAAAVAGCTTTPTAPPQLDLPPSLRADPLGAISLRGRAQPIVLHALRPAATMVDAAAE